MEEPWNIPTVLSRKLEGKWPLRRISCRGEQH